MSLLDETVDCVQVSHLSANKLHTYSMVTETLFGLPFRWQGFAFDFDIDVKGGNLTIFASFRLEVRGVNPLQTLSDVSAALGLALANSTTQFESIAHLFGSGFSNASDAFEEITQSDKISLLLDATIDFDVDIDLSLGSIQVNAIINELSTAFIASIADDFEFTIGEYLLRVSPSVELRLQAENDATPFDAVEHPELLSNFSFDGDFVGSISIGVDGTPPVPASITLTAESDDITNAESLEFDLKLDIDLQPIKDALISLLQEIGSLSYPKWLSETAPFLPELRLGCVEKAGVDFLNSTNSSFASVSGFLDAITDSCSSKSLTLSGGYDSDLEQLGMNIVIELGGSRNL